VGATFSIVIPAYQAAPTIGAAVRSALEQTYRAHEIIVVDDGSTDGLASVLEPFGSAVTLIRKDNGGVASARNAGVRAATGTFMATLDADDRYDPRRLEALAQLAEDRPELDLLTTDARFIVDGRPRGTFAQANPFAVSDQRTAIFWSCFVGGWPAVRLERLRSIGGFDESLRMGEDWDCWLRLILTGSQAGLVDEPLYDYVVHPGGLSADRVEALRSRVRLLEKARDDASLTAAERAELLASIRFHREKAGRAEVEAAASRGALARLALRGDLPLRVRARAGLALVSRRP
jgi:glycosyltransferase involved in cell wall biosynthesis